MRYTTASGCSRLSLLLPGFLTVWMGLGTLGTKLLQFTFWLAFPLFLALYLALVALSATPHRADNVI